MGNHNNAPAQAGQNDGNDGNQGSQSQQEVSQAGKINAVSVERNQENCDSEKSCEHQEGDY